LNLFTVLKSNTQILTEVLNHKLLPFSFSLYECVYMHDFIAHLNATIIRNCFFLG